MKKVNVGVIGAGYWGKKHVHEYQWLDGVNLAMVCDLDEKNLKFCKDKYGIPHVTTDYKEVLESPDIDAVSICTSNETHYQICKDAFEAGKHALVEKPVTLNSKKARELVKLAEKKKLVFAVGHIFRFNNALAKIKELINKGFFQDIFFIKLQWTMLMPPIENRDILFDLAPHSFDILNYLLDAWPEKVTCTAKAYRRNELEEMAYIINEFDNDVIAHVEISWLIPGKVREVFIAGRNRYARINAVAQEVIVYESDYEYSLNIQRNNTIQDELADFRECIEKGRTGTNSGEIGAKTIEMIEAAKRSLQEERTIRI